ncbi:MAG: GAF domain-containing protein [Anaerolineae bacterium]|nr:MAG: GAF domain-containing protein [Anaerolineae bacterium]
MGSTPVPTSSWTICAHTTLPSYALYREFEMRSSIGVTLFLNGSLIGSIAAISRGEPRQFNDEEYALLSGIADQAALAIHNARLHEEIQQSNAELEQRVARRTHELQAANQRLRSEIRERAGRRSGRPVKPDCG